MSALENQLPDKLQILQFPKFRNLPFHQIIVIQNLAQCHAIADELYNCPVLGFDTESKPTFSKGEVSTGPHLIQFASMEKAYLFQVSNDIMQFLKPIFENKQQIKTGFGLKNDAHLFRKKDIQLNHIIELSKGFSSFGLKNTIGIKNAIALLFRQNFPKSKSISTSNWARKTLTQQQIEYAAADAYAALLVYQELQNRGLITAQC